MKIEGRIRISRPQGTEQERVVVELRDLQAGVSFASASISLEDFARCITGQPSECDIEVQGLDLVGLQRFSKTELVYVADLWRKKGETIDSRLKRVREAVAVHEVEGWKGCDEDAMLSRNREQNMDRFVYVDGERVTACAWRVTYTKHAAVNQET